MNVKTAKEKNIMISETGQIHGRGSKRYRWVSYLSPQEREHVKAGGTVLIKDNHRTYHNQTEYKQVTYYNGRYGHCNY